IDLIDRVVEVEAGASGPRQTESSHERLIAMVPATQRQAVLVRERGQIVRMRRGHHETNQGTALSGWSEHTHPGQFCQTFHRVFGSRPSCSKIAARPIPSMYSMAAPRPIAPAMFGVPASNRCGAFLNMLFFRV